eukprot:TRINITY_DN2703_c0_g1_i1.p1 TRINITY_DN2703_c0_g1~~TRINITY_DN2703_c0_g1_i1.p1  ORF type:complete len:120 (-),score=38.19 TRINITY_DN2703_c0_g1_i1:241-600(-)
MAKREALNASIFSQLEELQEDEPSGFLEELLQLFFTNMDAKLGDIRNGLAHANCEVVFNAAHYVKGSAASIGAQTLQEIFMVIEANARQGDLRAASAYVDLIPSEIQELKAALAARLGR